MRLSVIFFEGSWVTLSSWVWFWNDFPEGVRSLENQNLQFILANAFSSSELKKVYGIDGVPRNLVGMLLEQRGTKLRQRFSFLFLLLCFCFFVFVLFSVFDHLFIKCKYFSIGSGGAQVYFKKIDLISRKCWQLFEDWIFVKLCSYFWREVMFDTLSYRRKSVPPCSSCCGFKTFRRGIGEKVEQKQDWSTPPSSSTLCIWYTGLQRLLLFFGLFLSIFFCCCFLVCAQGC